MKFHVLEFAFYCAIFSAGWLIGRHESKKALDEAIKRAEEKRNKNVKLSSIEKEILMAIGYAVLDKYDGNYETTHSVLRIIGISRIVVVGDYVHLFMSRPGIFIGKKGEFINFIKAKIKERHKFDDIVVHEYDINDYIFPVDLADYSDY